MKSVIEDIVTSAVNSLALRLLVRAILKLARYLFPTRGVSEQSGRKKTLALAAQEIKMGHCNALSALLVRRKPNVPSKKPQERPQKKAKRPESKSSY